MDYIYNGEVQIFQDNLDRFLAVAQRLKLEGVASNSEEDMDYMHTPKEELTESFLEENSFVVENIESLKSERKALEKKQKQYVGSCNN